MTRFKMQAEKKDIQLFARVVPIVLVIWGTISGLFLQSPRWGGQAHYWLYVIAAALFLWGILSSQTLKPVYRGWSVFSQALGWLLTTSLMVLVYGIGFIPTGLIMRLFGVNPLHRKFDPAAPSYWQKRPAVEFDRVHCERQF